MDVCLKIKDRYRDLEIKAQSGITLRTALLQNGLSPYRHRVIQVNCGGLGVCGTCKVFILDKGQVWLRRSCQVRCFDNMEIKL